MSGNVWEWVEDGKGEYQSTAQSDPIMINPRTLSKMYRGGGFPNNERNCRSSVRIGDPFTAHASSLGFRLALSEQYDSQYCVSCNAKRVVYGFILSTDFGFATCSF